MFSVTEPGSTQKVCVAMGVYNGARFIRQQVDSIFAQDYTDWTLLVRDDASQDESLEILSHYPSQFVSIDKGVEQQGVINNFNDLLTLALESSSDYVALSDQDDVWSKNKLSRQMQVMQDMEKQYPNLPILVHSDLEVVDQSLALIAGSFMGFQGLKPETIDPLHVLLVQNFVTGCTIIVNRRLLQMALPIPREALMHDWWLALCAAALGKIAYVDQPLVKYRQHEKNTVGAKSFVSLLNPFRNNYLRLWDQGRDVLQNSILQAGVLAERIRQYEPSNPNLSLVEEFAQLQNTTALKRIRKINELQIHSQSKLRHQLMLSRLINLPYKKAS